MLNTLEHIEFPFYDCRFAYRCLRALLFRLPPEAPIGLRWGSCQALQRAGLLRWGVTTPPLSPRRVMGLDFPHPIGLAAGLDKDARYVSGLFGLGFGFVELGTVTLQPQPGNPQPRLFRLPHQEALINRMGFNSAGAAAVAAHLAQRPASGGIIGISIGTGRNTPRERAGSECAEVMRKLYPSGRLCGGQSVLAEYPWAAGIATRRPVAEPGGGFVPRTRAV